MSDPEEAELSDAEEVQFNLKVMINKQKTKVLFAEVDSHFADVLLSFLTLPLGKIVGLLNKHYGDEEAPVNNIGSLTSLYNGLANLDNDRFRTKGYKKMLLNPRSSFEYECQGLKLDIISYTQPTEYFVCEAWPCPNSSVRLDVSMHYGVGRCICGRNLKEKIRLHDYSDGDGGVFTVKDASFVISDDLRMVPNGAGSIMETLKNLGITDMDGAELRNVVLGYNEIIDLLRGSLLSRAPLSDVVLKKRQMSSATGHGTLLHEIENEETSNSKKMVLKVMVQKSTNKLLFAQSKEDFVDFLCSLLSIPLGGVERLLAGKTCLKNIDNLYRSLENIDIDEDKYFSGRDTKSRLMNPKQGYMSPNLVFPLSEETPRRLYCHFDTITGKKWLSYRRRNSLSTIFPNSSEETPRPIVFPKCDGSYVKEGLIMYMVNDDLTVTTLNMSSSFSLLNRLKIPFSDVEEGEVHIGLQEGLSILKASLTSTSALTDGLKINSMINTQPASKKAKNT